MDLLVFNLRGRMDLAGVGVLHMYIGYQCLEGCTERLEG